MGPGPTGRLGTAARHLKDMVWSLHFILQSTGNRAERVRGRGAERLEVKFRDRPDRTESAFVEPTGGTENALCSQILAQWTPNQTLLRVPLTDQTCQDLSDEGGFVWVHGTGAFLCTQPVLIHCLYPARKMKHVPSLSTCSGAVTLILSAAPARRSKSLGVCLGRLPAPCSSSSYFPVIFLPSKFPTTFNHKLVITLGFSVFYGVIRHRCCR